MKTLLCGLAESMMPMPDRLLAGVSGGADSVALLRILVLLRERNPGIMLTAVHVNHGLRGEASDGDERFVAELCARLRVPLICRRASLPPDAGEDECRQARYALFAQAYAETGAQALVLAHHLDDQAETVLEHLLRGAGPDGLCGMREKTEVGMMTVLRPLLSLRREQLRQALREEGQAWREDASNLDTHYLRNAIRRELMPQLEKLSPSAAAHIAQAGRLVSLDADELEAQTERFLAQWAGARWIRLSALRRLGSGLRRRVLRTWWRNCCGALQSEHALDLRQTESLDALTFAGNGSTCNLPSGWTAKSGYQCLHLLPPGGVPETTQEIEAADGAELDGIVLRITENDGHHGDGVTRQRIPLSLLNQCVLRCRRPGDRIRPFGSKNSQSLQDYLVNRKVDAPFRGVVPLLARGNEVFLVCGVGAGAIPPEAENQETVTLVWQGNMPWRSLPETENG